VSVPGRAPDRDGPENGQRSRILARIRDALGGRERLPHPGDFTGPRPPGSLGADRLLAFEDALVAAGGEVVRFRSVDEARAWLAEFASVFETVSVGAAVPSPLRPSRPAAVPRAAALGVSVARAAVAETGSLMLDARDGRRTQLLPPTHLVWIRAVDVHATLRDALLSLRADLPSAVGLHSGPSKSADIGQILVRGVHGPGRLVAGLIVEGNGT
jgi:L-lactate dehydrogenase complex protein LldG